MKRIIKRLFRTRNEKELKRLNKYLKKINEKEKELKIIPDEELKEKFNNIKEKIKKELNEKKLDNLTFLNIKEEEKINIKKEINKTLDKYIIDIFAIVREASKRILNMRHHDVQIIGGLVLNEGKIAEMKTGEGKTLVATLPVILNALVNKVYVITVNDYLAQRDANLMKPLYEFFDFKVGVITEGQLPNEKKENYSADIIYSTNTEFGFDYLRNNIAISKEEQLQPLTYYYAIIDEADSILIDEARSPLIISGPANKKEENYIKADEIAKSLIKEQDFIVDKKDNVVVLTEKGIEKAEKMWGVENLYEGDNAYLAHHLEQALRANYLLEKDIDYIVMYDHNTETNTIQIIDEFTGRIAEGRKFSDGLHQAIEAKERVPITEETESYASITYQMLFQVFIKLAGMTGTAQTDATELLKIYNLDTISIPTNKPIIRKDLPDRFFFTKKTKYKEIVKKVKALQEKGQPVLIGTISIEESEYLSNLLNKENIKHRVLNAKNHEQEAEIIAEAGQKGKVTVATNMAGRGVDIKLGEGVKELGGLYIIGASRNENRRIDDQLRGRSGRQGDPGTSQFYVSIEDELLKLFADEKLIKKLRLLGIKDDEEIESSFTSKIIKSAQKRINSIKFETRQNIYDYDKVLDIQRKVIYKLRQQIIERKLDIKNVYNSYLEEYVKFLYQKVYEIFLELENLGLYNKKINELKFDYSGLDNRIVMDYLKFITKENFSGEFLNLINSRQKEGAKVISEKFDIYSIIQFIFFKYFNESFLEYDFIIEKMKELNKNQEKQEIDENSEDIIKNFFKFMLNSLIFDNFNNSEIEKEEFMFNVLLNTLDRLWREHINKLEILRTGIGLRGYNQKEPLVEYKKESYELFQELLYNLKIEFIKELKKNILNLILNQEITTEKNNFDIVENSEGGGELEFEEILKALPPEMLAELDKLNSEMLLDLPEEELEKIFQEEIGIEKSLIGKKIDEILK